MRLMTAEIRAREAIEEHKKRAELMRSGVLKHYNPPLLERVAALPLDAPLDQVAEAFSEDAYTPRPRRRKKVSE